MALKIFWTSNANRKFDHILAYLTSEFGEKSTQNFVRKTYQVLFLLANYPNLGTIENTNSDVRGVLIVKQIRLFYKIRNNKLILLNFYDNR